MFEEHITLSYLNCLNLLHFGDYLLCTKFEKALHNKVNGHFEAFLLAFHILFCRKEAVLFDFPLKVIFCFVLLSLISLIDFRTKKRGKIFFVFYGRFLSNNSASTAPITIIMTIMAMPMPKTSVVMLLRYRCWCW